VRGRPGYAAKRYRLDHAEAHRQVGHAAAEGLPSPVGLRPGEQEEVAVAEGAALHGDARPVEAGEPPVFEGRRGTVDSVVEQCVGIEHGDLAGFVGHDVVDGGHSGVTGAHPAAEREQQHGGSQILEAGRDLVHAPRA
jgi:hypothetical protein